MITSNKIRLIGADLDGTLLNDSKQLCEGAAETVKKAAERGVYIVPVTGRPLSGVPGFIKELDGIEYVITSNGAQIVNAKTEKALFSFPIDNRTTLKIIREMRKLDCWFEAYTDGAGYAEPDVFDYYRKTFTGTPLEEYIFTSRRVTEKLEALFEGTGREADEIFLSCKSEAVRSEAVKALEKIGGLHFCLLGDRYAEITKKGADKGEALKTLAAHLGITTQETAAFGDGENDLPLLKKAGLSVAMENGAERAKELADLIAPSNNENGVCRIIEKLI